LSAVLSKPPSNDFVQVDSFLLGKRGKTGQQVDLDIGQIMLNYYCSNCEDLRTFSSKGNIRCIFVNRQVISIDAVLTCGCGADTQAWFLVECDDDICSNAPKVKIVKKSENLSDAVRINADSYGAYTELLDKAERAHREGLGAGAIVYLRKAYEQITVDTANIAGITFASYPDGNPKNFSSLLEQVDEQCNIVPPEFTANRYELFRELSKIVHGGYDEESGIKKYKPLKRLVIGILENVKNKEQLREAIGKRGWEDEGVSS
jgi:hypothetical protein